MTKKVENPEKRTNIDRHLCKSCIYRGSRLGLGRCNYIAIEGHSRGMPEAECTVYVKEERGKHYGRTDNRKKRTEEKRIWL